MVNNPSIRQGQIFGRGGLALGGIPHRFQSSKPWEDDATRRGFVNVSFGHLTIAATVEQPLGRSLIQRDGKEGVAKLSVEMEGGMIKSYIMFHHKFILYIRTVI